jgi:hypothetical protein
VIDESDEGGTHASGIAPGEVGVRVAGILFDLLIAEGDGGVGEGFDAVARGLGDGDIAPGGEEAVVGVVGGVEKVLVVELAEDDGQQDVSDCDGALGVGALDGLEAREGSVVVEDVEVLEGVADRGGEIDGVGVGGGVELLRVGWRRKQDGEEDGRDDFCGVFYLCSPEFEDLFADIFCLRAIAYLPAIAGPRLKISRPRIGRSSS